MQQNEDQKLSRVSTFGSTKSSDGVTTDELKSALGAEWVEIANRIDQELSRSPTLEEQFNSTDNTILRPGSFYELDRKTLQGPDQWGIHEAHKIADLEIDDRNMSSRLKTNKNEAYRGELDT